MDVELFLDTSIKEQNFDAKRQLSEKEYVGMLRDYSKSLDYGIERFSHSTKDPRYNITDVEEYEEPSKEDLIFVSSKASIFDINGYKMSEDELEFLADMEEVSISIIKIDEITDDLFDSELKYWAKDSMNINTDKKIDQNDRIRFLPAKTLKVKCKNKKEYYLEGCKIYEEYNPSQFAIIIRKITRKYI